MKNKIIIGVFVMMLASFIVMLALPMDNESIEAENREANAMPKLTAQTVTGGLFAEGFESYIGDHIGFRGALTELSKNITSLKGLTPKAGSIISTTKDIGTETMIRLTLLLADNTIMEMYRKNSDNEKLYTDAVNHYAEKLPDDIDLYSMIIPTQLEFKEPIYKNLQDSQEEAISDMYSMLDKRVKTVDVCDTMANHSGEYIYFRTDHHWTQLGAYYAYRAFMEAEGGEAVNKNEFEKNEIPNVLGFLYNRVDRPELAEIPDKIEWYDVDKNKTISVKMYKTDKNGALTSYSGVMYDRTKTGYSFFFGSDHPVVQMTNSENVGKKTIVAVKDSYTNAFAPWLIKSYYRVILVDPRSFSGDFKVILDMYKPQEVLITDYIFTTNFPDYCEMLKELYK